MGIFPEEVLSSFLGLVLCLAIGIICFNFFSKRIEKKEERKRQMQQAKNRSNMNAQSGDKKVADAVATTSDVVYIADTLSNPDKGSHNSGYHTGSNSTRSSSSTNNHDSSYDSGSSSDGGSSISFD